jgi:nitroreductase
MAEGRDIVLRALRRTRQVRRFTDEPVAEVDIQAILEVCRWTGSSTNTQQWQFIVIRDAGVRRRIAEVSRYARHVGGAPLAIAIEMPGDDAETDAYDEARVAERILIAAGAMDLGAGIGWAEAPEWPSIRELLGVQAPAFVRTIVSIGHPTDEARRPRTGPGTGRRPLSEFVREL